MSREVKEDLEKVIEFIKKYELSHLIEDEEFKVYLSQIHKKYYSVLIFIMELQNKKEKDDSYILKGKQKDFILEAISDLGNAVFLIINGAYKPARLILRSAIETFLKGVSINEISDIDKEKKIYKMFERISDIQFFKDSTNKILFDKLNQLYSELSKDIHTADINHMQHISSLNYFPTKSMPNIKEAVKYFSDISQIILTLLAFIFNKEFHQMHSSNKTIIIQNIKREYRQKINNIE